MGSCSTLLVVVILVSIGLAFDLESYNAERAKLVKQNDKKQFDYAVKLSNKEKKG